MSLTIVDFFENPSAFELKRIMHEDSSSSSLDISPAETLQSSVSVNGATAKKRQLLPPITLPYTLLYVRHMVRPIIG